MMPREQEAEDEFLLLDPAPDGLRDPYDDHLPELDMVAPQTRTSPWMTIAKLALMLAGAAWIGFGIYLFVQRGLRLPGLEQIPVAVTNFSAPLILIGLLFIMLSRSSVGEADRFARVAAQLRSEAEALDMRLALVNQQLDTARQYMHDQASLLEHYGGSASANLETAASTMAQHAATSAQQAEIIERSSVSMAQHFGQLIDTMPLIEDRAHRVSSALTQGSDTLTEKVERLEARLDVMMRLIDDARSRTAGATQSLTAQLMQIQDATRSASEEVTGLSDLSANRIAAAVAEARKAVDEIGTMLDVRNADLGTLVKSSRTAIDAIGFDAVARYESSIAQLENQLRGLDELVQQQSGTIGRTGDMLSGHIERVTEQFAQLETRSLAGSSEMARTIDELARRTVQLDEALQSGGRAAEAMISRSETLLVALDASVRELDEGHPAALARLDEKIAQSRQLLNAILPEIEHLEAVSSAILGRASETETVLGGQGRRLTEWLESGETTLANCQDQVAALRQAMEAADTEAKRLSDSAGPQLVATMLRVKEAADQAGERARQALARAIADATGNLGEASEAALANRLGESFQARIDEVSAVADRAVRAAHAASDRLMRQLITIADTTAAIEQRIAEANEAAERRDQDNFSRQSAMLIEALNSAAIDVTKLLAEEVSDSSWAAYLRGDRGVFTRRAVRLLDEDKVQEIHALYEANEVFRDATNRYIHDFESMLRGILTARDGSSLGVTLLSSDIGKLYVALAQATERLKA